jgi:hypothetical protein
MATPEICLRPFGSGASYTASSVCATRHSVRRRSGTNNYDRIYIVFAMTAIRLRQRRCSRFPFSGPRHRRSSVDVGYTAGIQGRFGLSWHEEAVRLNGPHCDHSYMNGATDNMACRAYSGNYTMLVRICRVQRSLMDSLERPGHPALYLLSSARRPSRLRYSRSDVH